MSLENSKNDTVETIETSARAPVPLLSAPLPAINNNRQYVKGFFQTNITDPERPDRFLDFGEDGTSGYVTKFGQIVQLCKMVHTAEKEHPYRYATVEPRSLQVDWRKKDPQFEKKEVWALNWACAEYREKILGQLTNDSTAYGLGIRIGTESLQYNNLTAGYRNGRFPETRYTLEGDIQADVQVNFVANAGRIAQQYKLTSRSGTVQEVPLLVDLSLALVDTPSERNYGTYDWDERERYPETCIRSKVAGEGHAWSFQGMLYHTLAALYCDGVKVDMDLQDENGERMPMSGTPSAYGAILHKRTVLLAPGQSTKFTLIFQLGGGNGVDEEEAPYIDVDKAMEVTKESWWQLATESASIFYRRNLESILSLAVHFPVEQPYMFPDGAAIEPIVFHTQSVVGTELDWERCWEQAETLITFYELLTLPDIASSDVVAKYRERTRRAVLGHLVFLSTLPVDFFKDPYTAATWDGVKCKEYIAYLNRMMKKMEDGDGIKLRKAADLMKETSTEEAPDPEQPNLEVAKVGEGGQIPDLGNHDETGETAKIIDDDVAAVQAPGSETPSEKSEDEDDSGSEYWVTSVLLKLFDFLLNSLRVFPLETRYLLKHDLRDGVRKAWTRLKKSRHERSKLFYNDIEPFTSEYGGAYVILEDYTLNAQVRAWRILKGMSELHPLIDGPDAPWAGDTDKEKYHLDADGFRDLVLSEFIAKPTSEINNPNAKPRFLTKRWGDERSSTLAHYNLLLLVPPENEYFFFSDGSPHPAWTETLENTDKSFPGFGRISRALVSYIYSHQFNRAFGTVNNTRKAAEVVLSISSVNCLVTGLEGGAPSYTHVKQALLLDYPEISKYLLEPSNFNRGRSLQRKKLNPYDISLDRIALAQHAYEGSKVDKDKLTPKDRLAVHDPPDYGPAYYFPLPEFITKDPPKVLKSIEQFSKAWKAEIASSDWILELTNLWKGSKFHGDRQKVLEFLQTLQFSESSFSSNELYALRKDSEVHFCKCAYELKNMDATASRNYTTNILKILGCNREKAGMKKLYLIIERCKVETVLPVIFSLSNAPAEQRAVIQFLNLVMEADTHRMSFSDQALIPDNLWVTEFNINFVALLDPRTDRNALKHVDAYAPKKRSGFVSASPVKRKNELPILTDISFGFRFVGDLHDTKWTCYRVVDPGAISEEALQKRENLIGPRKASYDDLHFWEQRKVLELQLVLDALTLVYHETENIMDHMDQEEQAPYEDKALSEPLLPPVLTANDLTGLNYYSTMHKHSTYYPWVLQCCNVLKSKLAGAEDMTQRFLSADKNRAHTPRWSEKDQANNRAILRNKADKLKRARKELELLSRRIDAKIESITTLKQSLEAELGLREARTSTQQATSIGLFTVVTVVFLPLSFAASILSIDLGWSDPVRSLHLLMWPTTIGTVLFLLNLPVIYGYFLEVSTTAQYWLRKRMADEKSWDFWKQKAQTLTEAEKRTMLMRDDQLHESETNWWYWNFFVVYCLISLPVRQLHTVYQVIRLRPVKDAGILKKLFCLLLSPIWMIILSIVYLVLLGYCVISSSSRGIVTAYIFLWSGREYLEKRNEQAEAARKAKIALLEAANEEKKEVYGKDWNDEETKRNDVAIKKLESSLTRGHLLMRPVQIMKLKLITKLPDTGKNDEEAAVGKGKEKDVKDSADAQKPPTNRPGTAQTVPKPASTHSVRGKAPSVRSNGSAINNGDGGLKVPLQQSESVKEDS
ncbi:hypothetical protein BJ508DRAFT_418808 [Ascobolus immersus RN42]|uniref:Uncharacterized protein n=1 Tax=Ascobolus immersus RN42 TaxID=1160509 RepID=A0A3N4HQF1_ASCIM|nr:hypothetical protein BJ508DRAFT_418808 [Ascobolus immersus RN42]